MNDVKINVEIRGVNELTQGFRTATETGTRRVVERGTQHLRHEVPKDTHNLEQGVSGDVRVKADRIEADLIVSAESARRGARDGILHEADGQTRTVRLRPVPAFDYAEIVAKGKDAMLRPKSAKFFLVPVDDPRGAYIEADGLTYIRARSINAVPPNPYDERAFKRLAPEVDPIMTAALKEIVGVQ